MAKILIIEDEADISKVLAKRLITSGFEVISASDAYFGVNRAIQEKPDLIILDLMLPAGGGLNVLKSIRLSDRTTNIPVLVLTGMQDEKYKEQVIAEGVEAFFEKPYDPRTLISTINKILTGE